MALRGRCPVLALVAILLLAGEKTARVITAAPGILSSLPELDSLRADAASEGKITRDDGNIDIISSPAGIEDIAICHLIFFMPFTALDQNGNRTVLKEKEMVESGVAVLLAAQHLNTGDGRLVPEIQDLPNQCPIRFTVEMMDTEWAENTALEKAVPMTQRRLPERQPCAIIGASRSAVSMPTSIISGLRGYPQVSGSSTSAALDDKSIYPLFGRTIPSDDGTAAAIVLYLRNVLGVRYLAMIHTSDPFGTAYARGMHAAVGEYAPDLKIVAFNLRYGASPEEVAQTVTHLKGTQKMFFFSVLFTADADAVMTEAVKQGIAGTGRHNWFFADGIGYLDARTFGRDSVLRKAYRGTAIIMATGGGGSLGDEVRQLRKEKDLAYLKSLLPRHSDGVDDNGTTLYDEIVDDSSFPSSPGLYGAFYYDAVVALGLAACNAAAEANGTSFDGKTHFDKMITNNQFSGASGKIEFDPRTGTRTTASAIFVVVNFVENVGDDDRSGNTAAFKAVQTNLFRDGKWGERHPFVFNDGTSNTPSDLPDIISIDRNYLTPQLRAVGLVLCGIILFLSLGFSAWTHKHRKVKVVRASQPIFLHIISAGTFIMACSIIPLSIDKGIASEEGSNIACMCFPWLICIGFSATFSAIQAKTHRINKIFNARQFRRIAVTPMDVAKPMIAILGANVIVLSLWSALAPLAMETVALVWDPFDRTIESYDFCNSDGKVPYLVCLAVINLGALVLATWEAFKAQHISIEFSESRYIFRAMAGILIVCFIGVPVIILAQETPSAHYFVMSGIIFVSCMCLLLTMFVPKIQVHHRKSMQLQGPKRETAATVREQSAGDRIEVSNRSSGADGANILSFETDQIKLIEDKSKLQERVVELEEKNQKLKESKLQERVMELEEEIQKLKESS